MDLERLDYAERCGHKYFSPLIGEAKTEIERLRGIFAGLRKVWFSGADLDKDAISQATLRAIIEAENTQPSVEPRDNRPSDNPSSMAAGPCVPHSGGTS